MSPLPEAPPPGKPREGPFVAPPWGLLGSLVGLLGSVFALTLASVVVFGIMNLVGIDIEGAFARYAAVFLFQGMLLLAPLVALAITGSPPRALGWLALDSRGALESVGLGVGLSALAWLYSLVLKWVSPSAYESMISEQMRQMELLSGPIPLLLVAALLAAPLCEEVFFRAFFFAGLRSHLNFAIASAISALVFAGVHFMLWSTPPLFLVGLGMALLYERQRSVAAPILAHATFNGTELLLAWIFTGSA